MPGGFSHRLSEPSTVWENFSHLEPTHAVTMVQGCFYSMTLKAEGANLEGWKPNQKKIGQGRRRKYQNQANTLPETNIAPENGGFQ